MHLPCIGHYRCSQILLSCTAQDCNLALLSAANTVIYSSSTGGEGAGCALTVSSLGGGFIAVSNPNGTVLFQQPGGFRILLEGQNLQTNQEVNQVYDLATSSVTLTANSPSGVITTARTLLPTINAILAFGLGGASSQDTYLYSIAAGSWAQTGPLVAAGQRYGGGLITLQDGSALAVAGYEAGANPTSTCETYSPRAGAWSATGSLAVSRGFVVAALLLTGQVSSRARSAAFLRK